MSGTVMSSRPDGALRRTGRRAGRAREPGRLAAEVATYTRRIVSGVEAGRRSCYICQADRFPYPDGRVSRRTTSRSSQKKVERSSRTLRWLSGRCGFGFDVGARDIAFKYRSLTARCG